MLKPVNIRRYLTLMEKRGISHDRVLEGTRIQFDRLQDPAYLVSLDQCHSVVRNMIRLSGDLALGLAFGQSVRISDLGIVGHALLSSRSMRQATTLWLQYSRSLLDMLIRFKIDERPNGGWSLRMVDATLGSPSVYRFCVEELLVLGHRFTQVLSGEPVRLAHLQISYAAGGEAEQYEQIFGCRPEFGALFTEIAIESPGFDQPLRCDPDELSDVCLRHCSRVMREIESADPIVSRLRSMLLRSVGQLPSFNEAARQLDMSGRTLRRRLLGAGTTYQELLDEFRYDMAAEYLRAGQMKPKEVAYLLGYTNVSTLRRAFKSWTGHSIGEFLAGSDRQRERG